MIEETEIKNLANLARIDIDSKELSSFKKDFEEILSYVSILQKINLEGLEEDFDLGIYPTNVFREDSDPHESGIFTKKILEQAPQRHGDYIRVDKILNPEQ